MKKLLILVMVLAMASFAGAALKISVNGVVGGPEVVLEQSQTVVLDIMSDALVTFGNGDWNGMALIAPIDLVTISGGIVAPPYGPGQASEEPGLTVWATVGELGIPIPQGTEGVGLTLNITGAGVNGKLFDEILFHCEGPGDTLVQLWGTQDYEQLVLLDTVMIHQIPEPVTIALLGLGGLFLRRRIA